VFAVSVNCSCAAKEPEDLPTVFFGKILEEYGHIIVLYNPVYCNGMLPHYHAVDLEKSIEELAARQRDVGACNGTTGQRAAQGGRGRM